MLWSDYISTKLMHKGCPDKSGDRKSLDFLTLFSLKSSLLTTNSNKQHEIRRGSHGNPIRRRSSLLKSLDQLTRYRHSLTPRSGQSPENSAPYMSTSYSPAQLESYQFSDSVGPDFNVNNCPKLTFSLRRSPSPAFSNHVSNHSPRSLQDYDYFSSAIKREDLLSAKAGSVTAKDSSKGNRKSEKRNHPSGVSVKGCNLNRTVAMLALFSTFIYIL
ncbi:hypothetical protein Ciccas_010200 [Cichlidogyrus casuarinus]|uniref:Uncharacterized protein n=1 Tax=Cichlidogyrus casuarinus TaxID=1844966 RepID=A0ABD2PUU4_9PLAT